MVCNPETKWITTGTINMNDYEPKLVRYLTMILIIGFFWSSSMSIILNQSFFVHFTIFITTAYLSRAGQWFSETYLI